MGKFKAQTHMDTNEFMLVSSRRKDIVEKKEDERTLDGIETSLDSHEIKLNRERHTEFAMAYKSEFRRGSEKHK